MEKRNDKGRAVFTGAVLLLLVIMAAITLKIRGGKGAETVSEPQISVEEMVSEPQISVEETVSEPEIPIEETVSDPQIPEVEEQPKAEEGAEELSEAEELARAEQERSAFLPDYDSFPLLETSPIKYLSMEVGADESEVCFNWMSTSSQPGTVTWYTIQNGDYKEVTAAVCFASASMPGYYVNKATVTEVKPGLSYAYKVGNDAGGWSPEYHYHVPEDDGETTTFLVTSDAQIGQAQYEDVQDTIDRWDAVLTRLNEYVPEAEFLFHLGDQVADYGDPTHYDGFMNHLGLYGIPLAPVVGNHDVPNETTIEKLGYPTVPYFYEHFNVPNRSEQFGMSSYDKDGNYYFVRDDVLFIVLNSSSHQEIDIHEEYVPQVIAQYPDTKWRVLVQHYPAYSGVEKYQESLDDWMRKSLAYIAEDNDIDLILTGHDHQYTRSYFTDRTCTVLGGYDYASGATVVNPDGCLYVTCSTASGCIYQDLTANPYLAFQGQPMAPTAIRVDITGNELHLTTYLMDSWTVYDEYTIRKE